MFKFVVVGISAFLVGAYSLAADTYSYSGAVPAKNETGKMNQSPEEIKEYVMMKDGKMIVVMKSGKKQMMDKSMVMSNGTIVMPDGTYVLTDGTKKVMNEGDRMDMEGNSWYIRDLSMP
ncbi:MAG: DUF6799 domain-containing protein [Endomicrobiales bacterium]|jgi:hypothetical protein